MPFYSPHSDSLGEKIKKRREELGLTAEDIAHEIRARAEYIHAIENNNYEIFSAKVYGRGFLKKVLIALATPEPEIYISEFDREWDVQRFRSRPETTSLPENRGHTPYLTPKRISIIVFGAASFFVLIFFGYRFTHFLIAPRLTIDEPRDFAEVAEPAVRINGKTEKESRLTVNGREVTIGEQGNFSETVDLVPGLNMLEFLVQDRFGKTNKETRVILVK